MNYGGTVPQHLIVGARQGFLQGRRQADFPWRMIASEFNMGAKSETLVDIGAAPMPKDSRAGVTYQEFVEKSKVLTVIDWDITVGISQNAVDDDQTGTLLNQFQSAGSNFEKHINKRVFQVLNSGDGQTYGPAYDGQDFFDSDHVDKGASYQTSQDNEGALTLSLDNFNTSWVAARKFRDDQGEFTEFAYDLLVVPPDLMTLGHQITQVTTSYDTANREENPYSGFFKPPVISAELDTTAWYIIASSENVKPLILAMKKEPGLANFWFDPTKPEGGMNYFKFFGRYDVHYGDWRLAYQGNT